MCASCLSHLLADARLKDESATCPNCRGEISKTLCTRNLAVEKAISELPSACHYCSQLYPRSLLDSHERNACVERYVPPPLRPPRPPPPPSPLMRLRFRRRSRLSGSAEEVGEADVVVFVTEGNLQLVFA